MKLAPYIDMHAFFVLQHKTTTVPKWSARSIIRMDVRIQMLVNNFVGGVRRTEKRCRCIQMHAQGT